MVALLCCDIPYLVKSHGVAHREDLGIDDACKHVLLMQNIEMLLYCLIITLCFADLLLKK